MNVVFVAGPFRGETAWDVAENVRRAEQLAFEVAKAGAMPLCPHANTANFDGTLTDDFWLEGTQALLLRCDAVIFTENWLQSSGARAERTTAMGWGIPVFDTITDLKAWLDES